MIKTMFAVAAIALAVPAVAQTDTAAPAAGAALPKCSATVRDSCDQSMTTERYAMSADAAMKTGGVGDRKGDNAAKAGTMPMGHKAMRRHHRTTHHHMMKHGMATGTTTTTDTTAAPPQ